MGYIRGKVRVIIYEAESNYKVGVLKVKETNDKELEEFLGKSLHFTGYFGNLQVGDNYEMEGNLIYKEKYGYQYNVTDYKKMEVTGYEAVIEFLTSDLIKGCGEATAKRIVDTLGNDAIKKIKEDKNILMTVPKMSEKKALKIYSSIMSNSSVDDDLIKLKEMGFSINEALNIINKFQKKMLKNRSASLATARWNTELTAGAALRRFFSYKCLRMVLMAPFSSRLTWAWEMPTSAETSIWVLPS